MLRTAVVCSIAVAALASPEAGAARQDKKAKHHTFHGVVVKVHHNKKDHDDGTFVVRHHDHIVKKDDVKDVTERKTFHVNEKTHFERLDHKGKDKGTYHKTNFKHLHDGDHVTVRYHGHHAVDVKITRHGKK
jgi:hypothetical protein